jgi:hypothetical protein
MGDEILNEMKQIDEAMNGTSTIFGQRINEISRKYKCECGHEFTIEKVPTGEEECPKCQSRKVKMQESIGDKGEGAEGEKPKKEGEVKTDLKTPPKDPAVKTDVKAGGTDNKPGAAKDTELNKADPSLSKDAAGVAPKNTEPVHQGPSSITKDKNKAEAGAPVLDGAKTSGQPAGTDAPAAAEDKTKKPGDPAIEQDKVKKVGESADPNLSKDNVKIAPDKETPVKQGEGSLDKDKNKGKATDPNLSKDNISKAGTETAETKPKGETHGAPALDATSKPANPSGTVHQNKGALEVDMNKAGAKAPALDGAKKVGEGKVPDLESANAEGIIQDLLEKHGLKEEHGPEHEIEQIAGTEEKGKCRNCGKSFPGECTCGKHGGEMDAEAGVAEEPKDKVVAAAAAVSVEAKPKDGALDLNAASGFSEDNWTKVDDVAACRDMGQDVYAKVDKAMILMATPEDDQKYEACEKYVRESYRDPLKVHGPEIGNDISRSENMSEAIRAEAEKLTEEPAKMAEASTSLKEIDAAWAKMSIEARKKALNSTGSDTSTRSASQPISQMGGSQQDVMEDWMRRHLRGEKESVDAEMQEAEKIIAGVR